MGGMRRIVLVAVVSAFALSTAPTPVAAANRLVIKDAVGDQSLGGSEFDLVEVEVATEERPGKGRWLVLTWKLAGEPPPAGGSYGFEAIITGCDLLTISVTPGALLDRVSEPVYGPNAFTTYASTSCPSDGEGNVNPPSETVLNGSILQVMLPTAWFPISARSGTLKGLRVWSEVAEPVAGLLGSDDLRRPVDEARARDTFSY